MESKPECKECKPECKDCEPECKDCEPECKDCKSDCDCKTPCCEGCKCTWKKKCREKCRKKWGEKCAEKWAEKCGEKCGFKPPCGMGHFGMGHFGMGPFGMGPFGMGPCGPRPPCGMFPPPGPHGFRPCVMPRKCAPLCEIWKANAVVDEKFVNLKKEDYQGKYLVILFYPFDFTYVCPTEIISFSDNIENFRSIGAEVIAISTDSHHTHLAWIKTPRSEGGVGKLKIPLVADISKGISKSFNVLVEDPSDKMFGASLRGLFIIDDKGIIRSVTVNDENVGRNVEETLRLIQGFKHADEFGDVCPANWKPGKATIIPDQAKKMEYFKKEFENNK